MVGLPSRGAFSLFPESFVLGKLPGAEFRHQVGPVNHYARINPLEGQRAPLQQGGHRLKAHAEHLRSIGAGNPGGIIVRGNRGGLDTIGHHSGDAGGQRFELGLGQREVSHHLGGVTCMFVFVFHVL